MEQSFAAIRAARPTQLFIAADGARTDRAGEGVLCSEARSIIEKVDWPCEVHTLFRNQNLGCRKAVVQAITWFFESVEEGVILEDDCVPDPSFFQFCEELLARYRYDRRIMVISGDNYQHDGFKCDSSYYFSKYPHCWGWATWRRAWALYDDNMSEWPHAMKDWSFRRKFHSKREYAFWIEPFDNVKNGSPYIWDVVWVFCNWLNGGLSILPSVNLVENVGFGQDATHTKMRTELVDQKALSVKFPLIHPRKMKRNVAADRYTDFRNFSGSPHCLLIWLKQRWWRFSRWLFK